MPSFEAFIKFSEMLFCFDYNNIIKQTDTLANLYDQIEYLLFAISEAKRVIDIFNHFEDRIISIGEIFKIKPMLETCFLASLSLFTNKNLIPANSIVQGDQLDLPVKTECELYNYIDRVKVSLSLLKTELHYRKNLAAILPSQNTYTTPQQELFVKEK